jgi:hypothetical protein
MVCPNDSLTYDQRSAPHDGFGAHAMRMTSVVEYAARHNLSYCVSGWPHSGFGHASANLTRLWYFVGGADYGPLAHRRTRWTTPMDLRSTSPDRDAPDEPDDSTRARLRSLYLARPKPPLLHFEGGPRTINVAIHVRRGDLLVGARRRGPPIWMYASRITNDTELATCAAFVRRAIEVRRPHRRTVRWHVFSEGIARDFVPLRRAFEARGLGSIELHLDADVESAFHHLVSADALVLASSSFSWAAAYFGAPARSLFHTRRVASDPQLRPLNWQFGLTYHSRSSGWHFPGIQNCLFGGPPQ